MRLVRSSFLACVLAVCACSDDVRFLSLAGLESSLVVLARVRADQTVLDATIVDRSSAPAYFAAEAGDTLHAFALDEADVRDAEGRPLSSDELATLSVDLLHREAPSGS